MITLRYEIFIYYFIVYFVKRTSSFIEGTICQDHNDCSITPGYKCRDNFCVCDHPCDGKYSGERCISDHECMTADRNLLCLGKIERTCRCRKMHIWDSTLRRCLKNEDEGSGFDPVQNFIIPAIIVMSVGAMVYLGIKLFCNCGKLWRRSRSQLSRELENMSAAPHQPATWVASYRVFSPLGSQPRPAVHSTPCMGLFLPSQTLSSSPPPYEEALKHKIILSSYHPTTSVPPPPMPLHVYIPQTPPDNPLMPVAVSPQNNRIPAAPDGDQSRPVRYYPEENSPVWTSQRGMEETEADVVRPNPVSTFRRGHRPNHRRYSPEPERSESQESET